MPQANGRRSKAVTVYVTRFLDLDCIEAYSARMKDLGVDVANCRKADGGAWVTLAIPDTLGFGFDGLQKRMDKNGYDHKEREAQKDPL